jgi:hypothetical protein
VSKPPNCADIGIENKSRPTKASTAAAVFDTKYSSPAHAPAKNGYLLNEIR